MRAHFVYHSGAAWDAATEYVFASPYVQPHPDFAEYARASFVPARPVLAAACDLMTRIHQEFTYETASTDINTPALEALKNRKGVCQDFAHILIGCLRTQGLAARYVSGYFYAANEPDLASHAWASYHDVVSTTAHPKPGSEDAITPQDQRLETTLAHFWPGGTIELTDHETFRLGGERPHRYTVWQITRQRWHLVEWADNTGALLPGAPPPRHYADLDF